MKKLLLILSLTLGLANPVFALEAGERHADPYKVMTKGKVIGQETQQNFSWLLIAYQDEMYSCGMDSKILTYSCVLLEPRIN